MATSEVEDEVHVKDLFSREHIALSEDEDNEYHRGEEQSGFDEIQAFVRRHVNCPRCTNYYTDPRTLPCLHSYCKKCLEELAIQQREERVAAQRMEIQQSDEEREEESDSQNEEERNLDCLSNRDAISVDSFTCPQGCEGDTGVTVDTEGVVDGLPPTNRFLSNLVDFVSLQDSIPRRQMNCFNCDEGLPAIAVCNNPDCANKPLCYKCLEHHLRSSNTKEHRIVHAENIADKKEGPSLGAPPAVNEEWKYLERRNWPCYKHPKYIVDRYCYNHQEVICRECSDIRSGHCRCPDVEAVDDCIEKEIGPMMEKLDSANGCHNYIKLALKDIETMRTALNWNREYTMNTIKEYYNRLIESLKQQRESLIEQTKTICLWKGRELDKQKDKLKRVSETFTDSSKTIRSTINAAIPVEFMFLKESFHARLEFLVEHYRDYHRLPMTVDTNIYLMLNDEFSVDNAAGSVCGSPFIESFTIRNFPPSLHVHRSYTFEVQSRDICNRKIRGRMPKLKATMKYVEDQYLSDDDDGNHTSCSIHVHPNHNSGTYTVYIHPTVTGRHVISIFYPQQTPLSRLYVKGCPFPIDVES